MHNNNTFGGNMTDNDTHELRTTRATKRGGTEFAVHNRGIMTKPSGGVYCGDHVFSTQPDETATIDIKILNTCSHRRFIEVHIVPGGNWVYAGEGGTLYDILTISPGTSETTGIFNIHGYTNIFLRDCKPDMAVYNYYQLHEQLRYSVTGTLYI